MTAPLWQRLVFPPTKPEGWPEHDPPPEVTTYDPWPVGVVVPAPVRELAAIAEMEGWPVRLGYSRGPERAVRIGTYKRTESVGVHAAAHPSTAWRFLAVYAHTMPDKAWAWEVTIWLPGHGTRFTDATVTDLKEWLSSRGDVGPAWFKAVHARVEDQKARAREAARNRPKAKKEGSS